MFILKDLDLDLDLGVVDRWSELNGALARWYDSLTCAWGFTLCEFRDRDKSCCAGFGIPTVHVRVFLEIYACCIPKTVSGMHDERQKWWWWSFLIPSLTAMPSSFFPFVFAPKQYNTIQYTTINKYSNLHRYLLLPYSVL